MIWVTIEHHGKPTRVPAMKYQNRLWFHLNGETHVVDLAQQSRRAGGDKGKAHPGVIAAPMPGKVTKVTVKKDDTVTKGQALVVMEAMKMEYTLEADRDGKIQEVNAQVGAQVNLGEVLVRVVEA